MKLKIVLLTLALATSNARAHGGGLVAASRTALSAVETTLTISIYSAGLPICIFGAIGGTLASLNGVSPEATNIGAFHLSKMAGVLGAIMPAWELHELSKETPIKHKLPSMAASLPLGFMLGGAGAYLCSMASYHASEWGEDVIFDE